MARKGHEQRGRYDSDAAQRRLEVLRTELLAEQPENDNANAEPTLINEEVADIDDVADTSQEERERPLSVDEMSERRGEIKKILDIIYQSRRDLPSGTKDKTAWYEAASQALALTGLTVEVKEEDFFGIVEDLRNEDTALKTALSASRDHTRRNSTKDETDDDRPSEEALEALRRLEAAYSRRSRREETNTSKPKSTKVPHRPSNQQRLADKMESATQAWAVDDGELDIIARERYRRQVARGTAPKGASSPAVTTPGFAGVAPTSPPAPRSRRTPAAASPRVVDPRLAGTISYDARGHAHWQKGVADKRGKFAHNGHIDTILGGHDERERQNALYAEAQKIHAAVADIDAEIATNSTSDDIATMRRQLVAHHAFGADTALKVGNMSDEAVEEFVGYMRTAHSKATAVPASSTMPTDPLDPLSAGTYVPAPAPADPLDALAVGTYVPSAAAGPVDPLEALAAGAYVPTTTGDILAALATGTYVPAAETGTAMSPELTAMMNELASYRDRYAELTAKDRTSYVGRFLSDDSRRMRFLRRMPFVARAFDAWNEHRSEAIDDARMEYEAQIDRFVGRLDAAAGAPADSSSRQRRALLNESIQLETRISQFIKERGGERAGMFTNWWMKQEGDTSKWKWRSRLKKVGAVAAASGAIAFGAGFLVPGAIFGLATGTVAGGITGGLLGRSVTRHRGNARVAVGRGSQMDYADVEAAYNTNRQYDALRATTTAGASTLTEQVEAKTTEEMVRNRRRLRSTVAVGKLAGGLSGLGAGQLRAPLGSSHEVSASAGNGTNSTGPAHDGATPGANEGINLGDRYQTLPHPELTGNTFYVESGNGLIREWSQWAGANNHSIDSETAKQLHAAVRQHFGDKGILKQLGTYVQNGDLRIARSGMTSWADGVPEFAQQWLAARGKW